MSFVMPSASEEGPEPKRQKKLKTGGTGRGGCTCWLARSAKGKEAWKEGSVDADRRRKGKLVEEDTGHKRGPVSLGTHGEAASQRLAREWLTALFTQLFERGLTHLISQLQSGSIVDQPGLANSDQWLTDLSLSTRTL